MDKYKKIINDFRKTLLKYRVNDCTVSEIIAKHNDPFEIYALAKFCQTHDPLDVTRAEYEVGHNVRNCKAFQYF